MSILQAEEQKSAHVEFQLNLMFVLFEFKSNDYVCVCVCLLCVV